ncbi:MAG: leucyl aminopeptidase family protein [Pseudomonadota bacterium]
MLNCFSENTEQAKTITVIPANEYSTWLGKQNDFTQNWLRTTHFRGEPGNTSIIPDLSGGIATVLYCISDLKNFWGIGSLPLILPEGVYKFENETHYNNYAIAWGLGSYQFSRYKKPTKTPAQLLLPKDATEIINIVEAIYLVRDLINTPTDDMGPSELAQATVELSKSFNASVKQIIGDDLLTQNYAQIHTVGRASDDAPRLLDMRWGDPTHPRVTLIGKGVCFDTGGLDLKPSAGMLLMKKDMAGGAHALGLARMIMTAKLPINLRLLIPAVENSVSGNAYRPGDIIKSRKGITVEIGNTDAEGRLVIADALAEAVTENPELLIDFSTLTGAARVALGTDIAALFSNNDALSTAIMAHGEQQQDYIWRLPLFGGYREALNSNIADINNSSADGYAGAITAGLFLKEFVPNEIPWIHFDMMAWNLKTKPGKPAGGEAMTLRAVFSYLVEKYS